MTWRCVAFFKAMRLYRGKIFARWVYPYTNARNDMTMRCFFFKAMRLYRGRIFARWVYPYTNARDDMTMRFFFFQSNAFVSAVGNSPPFLTNLPFHDFPKHFNHSSWFQISGNSWKCGFVKNGGEFPTAGLYLCRIFARWVYNNTNARDDMTISACDFDRHIIRISTCENSRLARTRTTAFNTAWCDDL